MSLSLRWSRAIMVFWERVRAEFPSLDRLRSFDSCALTVGSCKASHHKPPNKTRTRRERKMGPVGFDGLRCCLPGMMPLEDQITV